MRIIAGERRSMQLQAPRGMETRPTQAKVRESLFSMIQTHVPDAVVLDLFAGSGALALEALSRGAYHATLVDVDREAGNCIRRNIEKLRYSQHAVFYAADWRQALSQLASKHARFDLVFLDPPYRMTDLAECCRLMADNGLLLPEALVVWEHKTDISVCLDPRFVLYKQRTYGDTEIHFYLYQAEGGSEIDET